MKIGLVVAGGVVLYLAIYAALVATVIAVAYYTLRFLGVL